MTARPFIKFPGGKARLASRIIELMPKTIRVYREPFVGGGAVFFALANELYANEGIRYADAVLSDVNAELMTTYRIIRDEPETLTSALRVFENKNSEEFFAEVRSGTLPSMNDIMQSFETWPHVLTAARMIYLNKTCFNGLYRVNASGQFNAPWGKYKNPTICDEENIDACSVALEHVDLIHQPFDESMDDVKPGDVVYFDPPYVELSKTSSFTAYTPGGFGLVDQVRLANMFRDLAAEGVHVILSNADTPLTRELYRGFEVHLVGAARSINSKSEGRGDVGELLVVSRGRA